MNPLEHAIALLHPSKIFCSKIINMDKEGSERLIGLSVDCSPLDSIELVDKIERIIGADKYSIYYLPNAMRAIIETK